MKKIKSFQVDHRKLDEGIYVSRIDGDAVTYDLRFCKPNTGKVLDNSSLHTTEHMLATFLRNSQIGKSVLYFGPMGCQTGFYLIVRDSVSADEVLKNVRLALKNTVDYDGEVFGASEIECGNYKNLELSRAQDVCGEYLNIIKSINEIIDYDAVNKKQL